MKKIFILIAGFTLMAIVTNSQVGIQIKCAEGWWTDCCRCKNCIQVDPPPAYGYCRHCRLLCANCRAELGDLEKLWEKLRNKNRALHEAYKANQADYNKALQEVNEAYDEIWGEDVYLYDPITWGNNLKGSFGSWFTSQLSLASNFGGGRALTVATNIISVIQSGKPPKDGSEVFDFGSTWGGLGLDIIGDDGFQEWYEKKSLKTVNWNLVENYDRVTQGDIDYFLKYRKDLENDLAKTKSFSEKTNLFLDLISMAVSTNKLANDIYDLNLNLYDADAAKKLMESVPDTIAKNADLMVCIKETLDSLKSGGIGKINKGNYSTALINLGLLLAINNPGNSIVSPNGGFPYIYVNTEKTRNALGSLNQLKIILDQNLTTIEREIVPLFTPWKAGKTNELKKSTQLQLANRLKAALTKLSSRQTRIKALVESVRGELLAAFTGYEVEYDGTATISQDTASFTANNNWELSPAPNVKGDFGTVKLVFPTDAEWSVDFYTAAGKFLTNRSKQGKQSFELLPPGRYKLQVNSIPIENVVVEKGKQTELKWGLLDIRSHGNWEIRSSGDRFLTSYNKPKKMVIPEGQYILNFEGAKQQITIRRKMTLRFRVPVKIE